MAQEREPHPIQLTGAIGSGSTARVYQGQWRGASVVVKSSITVDRRSDFDDLEAEARLLQWLHSAEAKRCADDPSPRALTCATAAASVYLCDLALELPAFADATMSEALQWIERECFALKWEPTSILKQFLNVVTLPSLGASASSADIKVAPAAPAAAAAIDEPHPLCIPKLLGYTKGTIVTTPQGAPFLSCKSAAAAAAAALPPSLATTHICASVRLVAVSPTGALHPPFADLRSSHIEQLLVTSMGLHRRGIAYLDWSPRHIFSVTATGELLLIDFGYSKPIGAILIGTRYTLRSLPLPSRPRLIALSCCVLRVWFGVSFRLGVGSV
jgi:hypothetical protein